MKLKHFAGVLIAMFFSGSALSQQSGYRMIAVKGNIVDAVSGDPVKASIIYESLPYGSKVGIFSGSSFHFNLVKAHNYILKVTAEGYATYRERLDLIALDENEISKRIALTSTKGNHLIRLDKLTFGVGKANISQESYDELNRLVEMLNKNVDIIIQLEGHTDFRGNSRKNMKLARKRVDAVKQYLVANGIAKGRIKTKAYGGEQPLTRANNSSARKINRRVEVRVLGNGSVDKQ